jgi:RimJ/RimL family protein N-acetyltransferase
MAPRLSVSDRIEDGLVARIKAGLAASDPALGAYARLPLTVLLQEPESRGGARLLGGLIGETAWQWLSVRLLWVDAAHRRAGHGRRLLAAAEAEGRRRGCRHVRLNTFSSQAAGFYERCGYRQVLTLPDFPQGHDRLFYSKPLTDGAGPAPATMPRSLRTARLLLRQFEQSDLDAIARLYADARFMRHLGPLVPRDDSWRHMAMLLGHWRLRGYGMWAVEYEGRCVGRIGLHFPEGWPDLEVGWALDPELWGRGLATEGARAALEQAARVLGRRDPVSVIHPDNAASIRVAEKLGAHPERRMVLRGEEAVVYRHRYRA